MPLSRLKKQKKSYENLKRLLDEEETFPLPFIHKFIGKNTPRFVTGVERFEKRFPKLKLKSSRMSKGDAHVALTYSFTAVTSDEIITVLKATGDIEDVLIVL